MKSSTKMRAAALGLAGALAIGTTATAFADSWRPAVAAGAGFVAGTVIGAAISARAQAYPYGYAYAPGYVYAPGYTYVPAYAGAYAYAPGPVYGGGQIVGYKEGSQAPIYAWEVGPGCSLADKQFERC